VGFKEAFLTPNVKKLGLDQRFFVPKNCEMFKVESLHGAETHQSNYTISVNVAEKIVKLISSF